MTLKRVECERLPKGYDARLAHPSNRAPTPDDFACHYKATTIGNRVVCDNSSNMQPCTVYYNLKNNTIINHPQQSSLKN